MSSPEKKNGFWAKLLLLGKFFVKILTFGFVGNLNKKDEEENESAEFTAQELKELKSEIKSLPKTGPWLEIRGIKFPAPGHIFRLKETSRYRLLGPGSLVFVQGVEIFKFYLSMEDIPIEARCLSLDNDGRLATGATIMAVRITDLAEVENEQTYFDNWKMPAIELNAFPDGEAVETVDEIMIAAQGMMGAAVFRLPKGAKGIIDLPTVESAGSLDNINSSHLINKIHVKCGLLLLGLDASVEVFKEILVKNFSIPFGAYGDKCKIYFPSFRAHFDLNRSQIRKRAFEPELFNRVILDDDLRTQIISLAKSEEKDLKRWGVANFQKGWGKIYLAYGAPGTGKTMTGEALAEFLGRPLYIVNSMDLGLHTSLFEANFKNVIERTARWNSVTVIDEAESILRSRDLEAIDSNIRITAVLRNLEGLERGIIWFTTNRPFDIDIAIESRIRAMFFFKFPDEAKRRKIWEVTMPSELPIDGMNETILNEITSIQLDGREIKNAIQNAADMASSGKLENVPAEYLLKAAKLIQQNREIMANAKKEGGRTSGKTPGQYL